jgi:hypothetical protein
MSADPCLDAALAFVRPSLVRRLWSWYKRVTGYEPRKVEAPRYQSTAFPSEKRCNCGLCDPRRLP